MRGEGDTEGEASADQLIRSQQPGLPQCLPEALRIVSRHNHNGCLFSVNPSLSGAGLTQVATGSEMRTQVLRECVTSNEQRREQDEQDLADGGTCCDHNVDMHMWTPPKWPDAACLAAQAAQPGPLCTSLIAVYDEVSAWALVSLCFAQQDWTGTQP